MASTLKAFVTMDGHVSNVSPSQVSPFGELSTWSMTYSKEKKEYYDPTSPGHKMFVFSSKNDITGVEYVPGQGLVNQCISVVKACLQFSTQNIQPLNPVQLRNHLLSVYNNPNAQLSTIEMGPFVSNGPLAVPQWISWVSVNHDQTLCKIWLSDEAFSNQYDEFEIVVVPPLVPIDNLHATYQTVLQNINARSQQVLADQISAARDRYPETYLRLYDFDLVDQIDPSRKIKTTWGFLIYSRAGDNIDSIKDALMAYISSHTSKTLQEWMVLFPSIYKRTEFTIYPRWDMVSIPNLSNLSALYSGIMDPQEYLNFATTVSSYPVNHTNTHTRVLPLDYKALSLVTIGGDNNVTGKQLIEEIIPDYIPVPSTSTDFGRMQINTRNWINFIMELVMEAETMTRNTSVPLHLRRIIRNDKVYMAAIFENVHYLVAAKSNSFY